MPKKIINRSIKLNEIEKSFASNNLSTKENIVSKTIAKINFVFIIGIKNASANKPIFVLCNTKSTKKKPATDKNDFLIPIKKDSAIKIINKDEIKIRLDLLSERFNFIPKKSDKNLNSNEDNKTLGTYGSNILSKNCFVKLLSKMKYINLFGNKIIFIKKFRML